MLLLSSVSFYHDMQVGLGDIYNFSGKNGAHPEDRQGEGTANGAQTPRELVVGDNWRNSNIYQRQSVTVQWRCGGLYSIPTIPFRKILMTQYYVIGITYPI